jgi:hypothetical protein
MAALGNFFVGGGFLSSPIAYINPSGYNYIAVNGDATIDKLRLLNYCMDDSALDSLTVEDVYTWDSNTLLYAEFSENLNGGTVYLDDPIVSWTVVRTPRYTNEPKTIKTDLDIDTRQFSDYTAVKGVEYYYRIYPITTNYILNPLVTNYVTVDYCKVILLDEDTGESYLFDLNLDLGQIETTQGRNVYDTGYYLYPAVARDGRLYDQFSINCLLGYMDSNNNYIDNIEYLDSLKTFIHNGHIKVIKDRKGFIKRVDTFGFQHKIDENIAGNPTTISFSLMEVAGV